jgi:hypothetical protein
VAIDVAEQFPMQKKMEDEKSGKYEAHGIMQDYPLAEEHIQEGRQSASSAAPGGQNQVEHLS